MLTEEQRERRTPPDQILFSDAEIIFAAIESYKEILEHEGSYNEIVMANDALDAFARQFPAKQEPVSISHWGMH